MNRRYKQYVNENGGVVQAHVVTEDTEGEVTTLNGPQTALVGDVLVSTGNPYYAEVVDGKTFEEDYREATDDELKEVAERSDQSGSNYVQPGYDPSKHTAKEVNAYLTRVKSRDEYDRVAAAERDGRNRASAFPERDDDSFRDDE